MARVFGLGYVGELGGPAVIGGVAALTGIAPAFFIPFAFCLLSVGLAFGVRPRGPFVPAAGSGSGRLPRDAGTA